MRSSEDTPIILAKRTLPGAPLGACTADLVWINVKQPGEVGRHTPAGMGYGAGANRRLLRCSLTQRVLIEFECKEITLPAHNKPLRARAVNKGLPEPFRVYVEHETETFGHSAA